MLIASEFMGYFSAMNAKEAQNWGVVFITSFEAGRPLLKNAVDSKNYLKK
jgi:hypothetical protein